MRNQWQRWTRKYFEQHHRVYRKKTIEKVMSANEENKENNVVEPNCSRSVVVKKVRKLNLKLMLNNNEDANLKIENKSNASLDDIGISKASETDYINSGESKTDDDAFRPKEPCSETEVRSSVGVKTVDKLKVKLNHKIKNHDVDSNLNIDNKINTSDDSLLSSSTTEKDCTNFSDSNNGVHEFIAEESCSAS